MKCMHQQKGMKLYIAPQESRYIGNVIISILIQIKYVTVAKKSILRSAEKVFNFSTTAVSNDWKKEKKHKSYYIFYYG